MKQLLEKYTNKEILRRLVEMYPDQKKNLSGYRSVLEVLRKKRPGKTDLIIRARKFDISGFYKGDEQPYAIEYTPWKEWLGAKLTRKSLDVICNCLWEMTWAGFNERKIQNEIKDVYKRIANIKT